MWVPLEKQNVSLISPLFCLPPSQPSRFIVWKEGRKDRPIFFSSISCLGSILPSEHSTHFGGVGFPSSSQSQASLF